MTHGSDYAMREYTSCIILQQIEEGNGTVEREILNNFLTSIVACQLKHIPLDEKSQILHHELNAMYAYGNADKLKDFTAGAIYGAVQYYEKWKELK